MNDERHLWDQDIENGIVTQEQVDHLMEFLEEQD